jgi:hypothetical protein
MTIDVAFSSVSVKLKGEGQTHLKSEWQPARFSNSLANAGFY